MEYLFPLILAGITVGICSGLFGIGGGTIIVPLMFFLLKNGFIPQTTAPEFIAQQVIFTTLAIVIFTSAVSSYSHWRRGGFDAPFFTKLALGLLAGSIIGSLTLVSIPEAAVKLILTAFFSIMAYSFAVKGNIFTPIIKRIAQVPLGIMGLVIGCASVLLGIAGGMFNVGILTAHGLAMKRAVGTAAVCGLAVSVSAVAASMLLAISRGGDPLGFIHIPFFLTTFIFAGLSSNLGARIAHRLQERTLKISFACYLSFVALWFIIETIRTYW